MGSDKVLLGLSDGVDSSVTAALLHRVIGDQLTCVFVVNGRLRKDKIRRSGLELGLPYDMVYRRPFPGPGLGVRILGEVKKEYADILLEADAIFIDELHRAEHPHEISQVFAVFLPVRSVGVVGDARRYEYGIALRAVETVDFMTARSARLPLELPERVSSRIINQIAGVSRVSFDVSSKPPATIEWE